jgi:phosphatidylinositol glycan class A protein
VNVRVDQNSTQFTLLAIISSVESAIQRVESKLIDMFDIHRQVKEMYSWTNVAERTEIVYDKVMELPKSLIGDRFYRYYNNGLVAGKLAVMIVAFDYIVYMILQFFWPRHQIDLSLSLNREHFISYCKSSQTNEIRKRRSNDSVSVYQTE